MSFSNKRKHPGDVSPNRVNDNDLDSDREYYERLTELNMKKRKLKGLQKHQKFLQSCLMMERQIVDALTFHLSQIREEASYASYVDSVKDKYFQEDKKSG